MSTWILALQISTLAIALVMLLVVLAIARKTWRIREATFELLEDARVTRKECTALFAQLQSLAALERKLNLPGPLPPLRGWAGSPDFLLTIADHVLERRPTTVLECSSGVSTIVVARCLQMIGRGHVYSLEHEPAYVEKTVAMLKDFGLEEWATVLHAPLTPRGNDAPWYDDDVLPPHIGEIQLLVVDGPPFYVAPLARLPALPRMLPRLAANATLILDDADREAETEIVKRWLEIAPDFSATHLRHEKGCVILER